METSTECRPTCPCKAQTSREAVERAAKLLGIEPDKASALVAMLSFHGWRLSKDGA